MIPIPKVEDIDRAFPTTARLGFLPKEVPSDYPLKAKWHRFFEDLFFRGTAEVDPKTIGLLPREGVDPVQAWLALTVLMGVRDMKHERKSELWPYLASEWFADGRWVLGLNINRFEDEEFDRKWEAHR